MWSAVVEGARWCGEARFPAISNATQRNVPYRIATQCAATQCTVPYTMQKHGNLFSTWNWGAKGHFRYCCYCILVDAFLNNIKNESIVSGFETFSESDHSWEKWNFFMKCTETIALSFTVLFLESFRVTSIQHSIIFHNIYQLVIKRPPRAYTCHDELYYVIAVDCSDWLSSCGERKKIELFPICLRNAVTALALRCVTEFHGSNGKCLRCVAVRFVTLRCVAEFFTQCLINYVRACVALPIAGNLAWGLSSLAAWACREPRLSKQEYVTGHRRVSWFCMQMLLMLLGRVIL